MDDEFGILEIYPALAKERVISITKILREKLKIEEKEGLGRLREKDLTKYGISEMIAKRLVNGWSKFRSKI